MNADQFDLLREMAEDLKDLRLEISGKVDVKVIEKIDKVIGELEGPQNNRDKLRNALILLGTIIESLPSIVKAVDSLMQK